MDKLILLAVAAVIILLAVLACGLTALALFYLAPSQPQPAPAPQQNGTPQPQPAAPPGNESINPQDYALWVMITNSNVESACFEKAKEEAGSNAWAVKGCTCVESAGPEQKQYTCSIETLDPSGNYFADISCSLAAAMCTVDTNYGTQNVTFGQLRQLYNSSG